MGYKTRQFIHALGFFPIYYLLLILTTITTGMVDNGNGSPMDGGGWFVIGISSIAGLIHAGIFYFLQHIFGNKFPFSNSILLSLLISIVFAFFFVFVLRGLPYQQGSGLTTDQIIGFTLAIWFPSLLFGAIHQYWVKPAI